MPIKEICVYNITNPYLYRVEKYVTVTLPRHAVYVVSLLTTQTMKFYAFLNTLGNQGFKAWILKWLFCGKNHDSKKAY